MSIFYNTVCGLPHRFNSVLIHPDDPITVGGVLTRLWENVQMSLDVKNAEDFSMILYTKIDETEILLPAPIRLNCISVTDLVVYFQQMLRMNKHYNMIALLNGDEYPDFEILSRDQFKAKLTHPLDQYRIERYNKRLAAIIHPDESYCCFWMSIDIAEMYFTFSDISEFPSDCVCVKSWDKNIAKIKLILE